MCAWRRSLKIAYHNKLIVEEANRQYGCGWIPYADGSKY